MGSDHIFEIFFNLSSDLICVAGKNGYFKKINPAWTKTLGWTVEELLAEPLASFIHPDDVEATFREVARQLNGETTEAFENRYRCKDGSYCWLEWKAIQAEEGTLLASARNITKRKQIEMALLDSEEKFRSIYLSANVAMIVSIDQGGIVTSWNPGAEKAFGYAKDEILGQPLTTIMPERYRQPHLAGLKWASESSEFHINNRTVELKGLHKDGHEFPLEMSLGAWRSKGKIYFSAVIHDITERKQAEEELQTALADAERANQTKSEFLATMSHEFRTPLNAILGFSEMLRSQYFGPLGSENYEIYAQDIHTSGEQMLALINDMLDIAAIEAGKRTMINEDIDVGDVLRNCIRNFEPPAKDSGIKLSLDIPDSFPSLYADKRSVTQIILNLLSNALKFTERNGTISMSVTKEDKKVSIKVSDTGIGIPPDKLPTVTDPFSQTHSDPHKTQIGTGLGLSIVKSLVEVHDGILNIESEVGKGTTVAVTFPLIRPIINWNRNR
jgi:PAS domain S-box-containing protein